VNPRDPNDPPPKPKLPPAGILGQLDPAQFSDEQRAQLRANDDAVAQWRALAMWVPTGRTQ
jgi:hypothetical protein